MRKENYSLILLFRTTISSNTSLNQKERISCLILETLEPDGTLTIVSNTDNTVKISEPLPGIESIISSLGFN